MALSYAFPLCISSFEWARRVCIRRMLASITTCTHHQKKATAVIVHFSCCSLSFAWQPFHFLKHHNTQYMHEYWVFRCMKYKIFVAASYVFYIRIVVRRSVNIECIQLFRDGGDGVDGHALTIRSNRMNNSYYFHFCFMFFFFGKFAVHVLCITRKWIIQLLIGGPNQCNNSDANRRHPRISLADKWNKKWVTFYASDENALFVLFCFLDIFSAFWNVA